MITTRSILTFFIGGAAALACLGYVPYKPGKGNLGEEMIIKEVKIGKQTWMAANLNTATFRNGDPIPEAKTREEWQKANAARQPAWSYYENLAANGKIYGKIYNGYAVNDPRGLAPAGWHVPKDEEWVELIEFLGGEKQAGSKLKSATGWEKGGNGNNSSRFSALPGGYRFENGYFGSIGGFTGWWTATQDESNINWSRFVDKEGSAGRNYNYRDRGLYVRCVRD